MPLLKRRVVVYSLLIVAVVALRFVAYSEHRNHVTLQLSRFANATDITKTVFSTDQQENIEPSRIDLQTDGDYVTFQFDRNSVSSHLSPRLYRVWIRLPSWSNYIPFSLPFSDADWRIATPSGYEWQLNYRTIKRLGECRNHASKIWVGITDAQRTRIQSPRPYLSISDWNKVAAFCAVSYFDCSTMAKISLPSTFALGIHSWYQQSRMVGMP